MNRKITIAIITLFLVSGMITTIPVANSSPEPNYRNVQTEQVLKGESFTHNVLLELFVTTWCGYCPSAEAVAKQLSAEYGEHFAFVTMVTDVNDKASERNDDYQVMAIPDGVFDGGYRREVGGQDGTDTYEGHIEDSGNRDPMADVDLEVSAVDNGDGTMDVTYGATYQDAFLFYDAYLRVYIVEKNSRYPDKDGHAIPYAFIDYAFDQDVRLIPQVEMNETMTWEWANNENATFDNYVVIGALFDKSSGVERYVVQSATTEQTNIAITDVNWTPEKPAADNDITVTANVTGDVSNVTLKYSICTSGACGVPKEETMMLVEGTVYSVTSGDFGDDAESIHFEVIAQDYGGNKMKSDMYEITFGESSGGDDDDGISSVVLAGGAVVILGIAGAGVFVWNSRSKPEGDIPDVEPEGEEFQSEETVFSQDAEYTEEITTSEETYT